MEVLSDSSRNRKVGALYHAKMKKELMSAFLHQKLFFSAWEAIWTSLSPSRVSSPSGSPIVCSALVNIGSCSESSECMGQPRNKRELRSV